MAFLYYQPHIFHTPTVLGSGGDNIDTRGVYTAMPENIGEFRDVLLYAIKYSGKEVPQIVWKYLVRINICLLA